MFIILLGNSEHAARTVKPCADKDAARLVFEGAYIRPEGGFDFVALHGEDVIFRDPIEASDCDDRLFELLGAVLHQAQMNPGSNILVLNRESAESNVTQVTYFAV